ncbi:MAG: hypothetical protein HY037_07395 [Nitrospirae bacterium]|nr:hypothetical protein [Candidatus Troglogloeales bacterium]
MRISSHIKTVLIGSLWCGLLTIPFMGVWKAALFIVVLIVSGILFRAMLVATVYHKITSFVIANAVRNLKISPVGRNDRQRLFALIGVILLLIVPIFLNNYYLDILTLALLYALLAVGLNITVGLTGLLDLGYAGFYGIGAYTYALLSTRLGFSFWLGVPLGGIVATIFGFLLGIITLRLRGDYLAIVTLGFVQIVYLILNNLDKVTNGPNGILQIGQPSL